MIFSQIHIISIELFTSSRIKLPTGDMLNVALFFDSHTNLGKLMMVIENSSVMKLRVRLTENEYLISDKDAVGNWMMYHP